MTDKVKIALIKRNTSCRKIAEGVGISPALLSFMLHDPPLHKGYEHRAAIARELGLRERDVFPNGGKKPDVKKRRAA